MHTKLYLGILVSVILGITFSCPSCFSYILFGLLLIVSIVLGIFTAFWLNVYLSLPHKTTVGAEHHLKQAENFRSSIVMDYETSPAVKNVNPQLPQIFGKTVDSLLQQLLDFVLRDYILIYIKDYAFETDNLGNNIKDDFWGAINNLHEKLSSVDQAKLIASDIVLKVTTHFEKIREAKALVEDSDLPPVFHLSPHVMSSEKEIEYLRTVSELMIMFLLPRTYSLSPTKYFLREVLCCKVFKPLIDILTDPDFFNRNIINYIEATQMQVNLPKKVLENANNFEELIDKIDDVQVLRSIRYTIVTKLMQATTLQNLNRAKGVDLDNDKNILSSAGIPKSDINAAKKLKKHINQLTLAKKNCEKKLISLGWDSGYQYGEEMKRVLSLPTILEHVLGRKYISQFLQTVASNDLIRFWSAVEELRTSQKTNWHQIGAEIFYTFIRNPVSEIKVDKNTKKRMEAFLLGDKGPEVFYEVQNQVVQTIEDKYYQPFLISDYYKEMVNAIDNEENISDESGAMEERQISTDSAEIIENTLNVGDHSNYARRKLDQLEEKLNNKTQALAALKSSMRPESKVLSKLEKEVEWLEGEKRQLEAHISRTEIWADNLGRWRAYVQSAEVSDEKEPPQFVLVVQMAEDDSPEGEEAICTGWVVCRNLTQFQELHKKLRPLCSDVRNLDLPTNTFKFLFGKNDKVSLEKAKQQIQKYLNFVLKDDRLNQSEAIYAFLSPSSENLKHSTPNTKKSRFSFSTLFKSGSDQSKDTYSILKESEEDDISQCLDTVDTVDFTKSNGNSLKMADDTIAEPLYALLSEIFDMRGVFKYVRKTLIGFVQVTYGRNINRQIYDTISWWFSEEMLHYYLTVILKNFWPGGTLAEMGPIRSKEEKLQTAQKAQEMFVNNVPELLTTLVGNNAGRLGAKKVFDAFQEKNMNKHLIYEVIEVVLDAVFPELG
uniref:Sorting nexin-25 n=1 Tax=Diabrotica virgifera virgifera TaxID=50390 RepID=A0A6P7GFM5_DIAVI